MNEKTKRLIHTVYGVVLSLLIVVVGVCLIVSCVQIYQSGPSPYTRASVAAQFSKIAIPVWACVVLVLGGIVLNVALPVEGAKLKGSVDRKKALAKMRERLDLSACDSETQQALEKQARNRITVRIVGAVCCVAAAIPALIYFFGQRAFWIG